MRLLLGHPDKRKCVKDGLAFDFQFSREIVYSNLTHPTFLFPALGLHRSLTESTCCTRISSLFARAMIIQFEPNLLALAQNFLALRRKPAVLRRQLPGLPLGRVPQRPRLLRPLPHLLQRLGPQPPDSRNNY